MSYITLALAAYALFALTNVLDKVVLGPRGVNPSGYLLMSVLWSPLALLLLPFADLEPPGAARLAGALLAGACFFLTLVAYFRAAEREEITRVAPLWQLAPIFVWILAYLMLDERLSRTGASAFALLIFGGLLLAARRPRDLLVPSSAMLLMIPATALWAAHNVLASSVLRGYDPLAAYVLIRAGMVGAAAVALAAPGERRALRSVLRAPAGTHALIAVTVMLSIGGFVLIMHALKLGPVSLVSALAGTGGLFVLVFAAVLARARPGLLEEVTSPGILLQKLAGTLCLAGGVALLRM
jgi:drug/metabolite transporter (DMT)-like permease